MINLLIKDFMVIFKVDFKTILKVLTGVFFIPIILTVYSSIIMPIIICSIFIFRVFQLEEKNKCELYFNSLPISKEDIVYSKYMMASIIVLLVVILTYIYNEILLPFVPINKTLILIGFNLSLILFSIVLPIIFKRNYEKSSLLINFILLISILLCIGFSFFPNKFMEHLVNGKTYLGINVMYIVLNIISLLSYVVSMYISKEIYLNKEISNY